jgi:DNA-binding HxlR family transcriptional regulator
MVEQHRSGCPINLSLEVLGDKWSLLIIRDMMFGNRRHFRELLHGSEEGIASNILSDRLHRLTEQGLVSRAPDPTRETAGAKRLPMLNPQTQTFLLD